MLLAFIDVKPHLWVRFSTNMILFHKKMMLLCRKYIKWRFPILILTFLAFHWCLFLIWCFHQNNNVFRINNEYMMYDFILLCYYAIKVSKMHIDDDYQGVLSRHNWWVVLISYSDRVFLQFPTHHCSSFHVGKYVTCRRITLRWHTSTHRLRERALICWSPPTRNSPPQYHHRRQARAATSTRAHFSALVGPSKVRLTVPGTR